VQAECHLIELVFCAQCVRWALECEWEAAVCATCSVAVCRTKCVPFGRLLNHGALDTNFRTGEISGMRASRVGVVQIDSSLIGIEPFDPNKGFFDFLKQMRELSPNHP
jgi:hypothetical protein